MYVYLYDVCLPISNEHIPFLVVFEMGFSTTDVAVTSITLRGTYMYPHTLNEKFTRECVSCMFLSLRRTLAGRVSSSSYSSRALSSSTNNEALCENNSLQRRNNSVEANKTNTMLLSETRNTIHTIERCIPSTHANSTCLDVSSSLLRWYFVLLLFF